MPNNPSENLEMFLQKCVTTADTAVVLDDIEKTLRLIWDGQNGDICAKIEGKVAAPFQNAMEALKKNGQLPGQARQLEDFLEGLRKFIVGIPKIRLTLAFEPAGTFVEKLSWWFKSNLKQRVILEIAVSTKIVGGLQLEYNGKYQDYSWRQKVEQAIEEQVTGNW